MESKNTPKNKLLNNNKKNIIKIELLKDLTNDSYAYSSSDNTFTAFKSIDNILLLIYGNQNQSIISYNLIDNKKIIEIKNAHENNITNFRHYLDNIKKRDLILSISRIDNNIKVWNNLSWECLLNLENINNHGWIDSSCFLSDNNQLYILTSNRNTAGINSELEADKIKVYDFSGNKIKEINDSNDETYYIDTYFDKQLSINFIITGNDSYLTSYNFNDNILYNQYFDNKNDNNIYTSLFINYYEERVNLITSNFDGIIRIWDFYSGEIIKKIFVTFVGLYGICLLDNKFLFIGCKDNFIRLVDIEKKKVINTFEGHDNWVLCLKKISHPQYGDCLISQELFYGIKLWRIKY